MSINIYIKCTLKVIMHLIKCCYDRNIFIILFIVSKSALINSWPIGFGGNAQRTSQVIPIDTEPSSTIFKPYEIWKAVSRGRIESSVSLNTEASKDPLGYIANIEGDVMDQ